MIKERLSKFRSLMAQEHLDMYLIPTSDFHNSEYVGEYFMARAYMSGFTGSAGTLVITQTYAALWTDGRYFLQAADQLKDSTIELMKSGNEGVPSISEFIKSTIKKDQVLAYDGRVFPFYLGETYTEAAESVGASVRFDTDLVDRIWTDRPELSANDVIIHEECYSGEASEHKLERIRKAMLEEKCNYHIMTSLDDIAWTLNMRGSDVACNPVFLSYLLIGRDNGILFADQKVMAQHKDYLQSLNIKTEPYNSIYDYIDTLDKDSSILIDPSKLNYTLYSKLKKKYTLKDAPNPSTLMKAQKNAVEMDNLRKCNIIDGVAMVRFLYWLENTIGKVRITEIDAAKKLEEIRSQGEGYMGISFDTISGYAAHGAIIHYEPTPETDVEILSEGLLLVDSGAQYLSGTTDITRTIAVGPLTEKMRHHYTMVLRANLNLGAAKFTEGVSGANLDILARAPFWDEGLDYNHGTGHGVGFFLNVHEGPQSFHWSTKRKNTITPLSEGMIITDEPGIYIEGEYGIRIENDLLCLKDYKNDYGQFMKFEALTLCPIDLRPVNFDEMTEKEISALNTYHKTVCEKLIPHLNEEEAAWLRTVTAIPEK